jgi:mannose-6-phosphate isomerase-like protein (cupin superfamily)
MPRPLILALTFLAAPMLAQTAAVFHTNADLAQREAKLLATAKASPTGLGTDIMDDYGTARSLLVVRIHDGAPELHQYWADQVVIRQGTITLVTGGTLQGQKANGTIPGEFLGTSIQGGKETVLHAGDVAHVPPGVPHQIKLAPNTTVTYLVFKEQN